MKAKSQNSILFVYFEELLVGELSRDQELIHSFTYSKDWLNNPNKFPLSLAMPLQDQPFGNRISLSFFENLLPEGEARDTLEKSRRIKGTFDFLREFGEDCAGAVLISPNPISPYNQNSSQEVLVESSKIDEAIDNNRSVAEIIAEMNPGYLSIAGAQDKFAAIYRDGKYYLPTHGKPTTHIVKVPIYRSGVTGSVINEYYCMKLAKLAGLNVPVCVIDNSGPHQLFVVERYDRTIDEKGVVYRIHQQDFCQAQGVVSENKYEDKGGPSLKDNFDLIKSHVHIRKRPSALFDYLDWICFNLLIGNNDSHSKNISLLLVENKIELAPFYDLMCTAIYPKLKRNFSFQLGGRDEASRIGKNQFRLVDGELSLKSGTMEERMNRMSEKLLHNKDALVKEILEEFSEAKVVVRISECIENRCKSLKRQGI